MITAIRPLRALSGLILLALVAACTDAKPVVEDQRANLGNFQLGHNVVVAEGMKEGPFSRKATEEEVQTALTNAMESRFGAYDGDKLYHIGLKVDAYALALPGVPVVFTPKSVLVVSANIWDDAKGVKLNDEPKLLTVFEGLSGDTIVGTGLTKNKREQLATLSANMARAVERWLLENGTWFGLDPATLPAPSEDDPLALLRGTEGAAPADAPNATDSTN